MQAQGYLLKSHYCKLGVTDEIFFCEPVLPCIKICIHTRFQTFKDPDSKH